ncbi:MAG: homoserine O-succinyltransferase [Alphaproteobacteria bacterium]|nr:MAG: homoserine O-succinyltransferase [Alphaproteobacteria bacterium]
MPLVAYKDLPTFKRLADEGRTILPPKRAQQQDIREMHIGLLNMMPDAALAATERQFFRLVGESNQIAQLYIHPFTLPELERSTETKDYINQYYETFEQLKENGLDALIVTGTNVSGEDLENEPFWEPLKDIMAWAHGNVASTLCSCLATHAVMQSRYNQKRSALPDGKLWGVYKHKVMNRQHPLVRNMNTVFDVPHSRYNTITPAQFDAAGMDTLIVSEEAGTHIAVSPDGFRLVCMQGHPEYDAISLLKEYQREVMLYNSGERDTPPSMPANYFNAESIGKLALHNINIMSRDELSKLNEELCCMLENTWTDSARSTLASWIGLVYQVTNRDRKKQFMDGIDPDNPLGI